MPEQGSLFSNSDNRFLSVVETAFVQQRRMTFDDLFDGFDNLYAVTYSSDVSLMNKLFNKFKYSEVIFGYPKVISKEQKSLFDVPTQVLKYLGSNKNIRNIASLLDEGKLRMLSLLDFKSHAKQYILTSSDGRHRVITGSANMSTAAMYGVQAENFIMDESDLAYNYYFNRHHQLLEHSGEISKNIFINIYSNKVKNVEQALEIADYSEIIGTNKAIVIENVEDTSFSNNPSPIALITSSIKGMGKKEVDNILGRLEKSSTGNKIIILPEQLITQKRLIFTQKQNKDDFLIPSIDIDYTHHELRLNDELLQFPPHSSDILSDIDCIVDYFNGLHTIKGNVDKTVRDFWKFMCWYLASPFISRLRHVALCQGYEIYNRLNNVGVMYGNANAGKTKLCIFLTKLMSGQLCTGVPMSMFTPTKINDLRLRRNGFPLFFEDVDSGGSWSAVENKIVKDDNWGKLSKLDLYPCLIVCMNKTNAFNSESKKRCLSFRLESGFDGEDTYKNSFNFNEKISKIKNNFYKLFLLRMFDEVAQIESDMIDGKTNIEYNLAVVASKIIVEIVREYNIVVPDFMYILDGVKDFAGNDVMYASGIDTLSQLIELCPSDFLVNNKKNQLIYNPSISERHQISFLRKELPYAWRTMDKAQMSKTLILDLDQVVKKGINIKDIKVNNNNSFVKRIRTLLKI